jgi:glycine oxidase
MFELNLLSRERYATLADDLRRQTNIDVGYRNCGVIETAATETDLAQLEQKFSWQRALGQTNKPINPQPQQPPHQQ